MIKPSLLFTADAHEEGATVDIIGIDLKPTDVKIHIVGKDSKTFERVEEAAKRKYLESEGADEVSVEDRLAEMTLGWEGVPDPRESEFVELPFSKENAKLFYEKAPFVREQVNRFMSDRANFMKGSAEK